ncbi:TPA: hypothetical protein RHI59_003774 [Acinetobacter baumannii]|uniref:hypothetical protein n=1 Tax=Acinetobacter baumannii TaxID=470 RepID=UPI00165EDC29|nr:hypothetical protein [Acinetobacter baumannii]EKU5224358.1 hypothetical protein [Acinetobacter baumannii]EKU6961620.1 hypothetical protein [Acinetobacter baumannii]EKV1069116.1 hypothetical protein [Acinetobacter baumannii]EKV1111413.1 hypothetical protein [Acinetobacter baumannii]EKV1145758.1 hypothetical protein [Acinetobacter baumannii]
MMTTATIILVLIAANINALGTLLLVKFKVISQKKAFSYFTWVLFILFIGLYFKLFGDKVDIDRYEIWLICVIGYSIVFGPEDWGMYDQNN